MKREAFLQRIAEAAVRGRAHRVRAEADPAETNLPPAPDADTLCETLAEELQAVGAAVETVTGWNNAGEQLTDWLNELQPKTADVWESLDSNSINAKQRLTDIGATIIGKEDLGLHADVGVTGIDWAIADSGTLVLVCGEQKSRRTAIAPRVHIAIAPASRIVADLNALVAPWREQFATMWPANITMITGPSKTGDIELKLTRGVHGPEDVRVLIVRGA